MKLADISNESDWVIWIGFAILAIISIVLIFGHGKRNTMNKKIKVAFICVHNSCRSQIAEALGKKYLSDICECYSAGTETKPQINQDAVRLMKSEYDIDMEKEQYSKLMEDIPQADIVISMGCNVSCPYVPDKINLNWGLQDPTGMEDKIFLEVMKKIEGNILKLREMIISGEFE